MVARWDPLKFQNVLIHRRSVPFSYLDYSFYFFIRYVNAFKFMSLERIKTFEELSPNATSMFEVSHDNNDAVLPVRNLSLSNTYPKAVPGQ